MTQPTEAQSKWVDKNGNFQIANRGAAIADEAGTADLTYDQNEVDMINNLKVKLNQILARIRAHGLIAD